MRSKKYIWAIFACLFPFGLIAKSVEVYDFNTKKVYLLPEEKLGPNMVRINLEGKIYWANAAQLKENAFQSPPFTGKLKQRIVAIQTALAAVNPQTYVEWEDGFRRDQHPEREIAIWEHIVRVYRKTTQNVTDLAVKKEIYQVLVICSYSERSAVPHQANIKVITAQMLKDIMDAYYK